MNNTESEFTGIGKKMPYEVPEGFFDRITGETLSNAHKREIRRKKKKILWTSLSAAASLLFVIFAGTILFHHISDKKVPQVVYTIPLENTPDQNQVNADTPDQTVQLNSDNTPPSTAQIISPDTLAAEGMDHILASLSDEELIDWAISIKSDPFIDETENNLP
jgi:hypothetical protein